jgi:hypothetical protein
MRKGFIASVIGCVLVASFWMSVPTGCATMVPPSGGPRDSIPPVLLNVTPPDSTVNFRGDRIVFTFDEDLDDPRDMQNNLFFSPSFDVNPELAVKGRTLTVRFRDSLEPRTTYVLNFGNAIVDVTEGNPIKNFAYTFSTGPVLDSLEISGKVLLAENGSVDSTVNVALYKNLNDSAIVTKGPMYIVRVDRNGNFRFHHLPKDTFAVYAFGGKRFQSNQLFAFNDTTVVAGEADSVMLYAYREGVNTRSSSSNLPANIGKNSAGDRRLRFNQSTADQQDLLKDFTLTFPVPLSRFDSTKMHLSTDSVFNPVSFTASLDSSNKEITIQTQWKEGTPYHLILEQDFATDTAGRQLLKTDTLSFTTKKREDYGSLALRLKNFDASQNPVLQFIQNGQIVFSTPISSGVFNQALFAPGEYSLRVLYDTNGNGKWDPGQFFGEKKQPEIAVPIQRTITIKPNWDNEFDLVL